MGFNMNRAEFEAELGRDGYDCREVEIPPNEHRPAHAHAFDARLMILSGAFTVGYSDKQVQYGPGDTCSVAAGTMHEEHTGAEGARYVAGRRQAGGAAAE